MLLYKRGLPEFRSMLLWELGVRATLMVLQLLPTRNYRVCNLNIYIGSRS